MPRTTHFRPISTVDLAAACASVVLPKAWLPRLDQTRLDLQSVLDSLRGRHEPPFRDLRGGPRPPRPLSDIDPIQHVLPRPLADRYATTRRDLRFLSLSLRGYHPPPFTRRRHEPMLVPAQPVAPLASRRFRVTSVTHPIEDAVTIELEAPHGTIDGFSPGQFLTLTVEVAGVSHKRAYSICSSPSSLPRLSITVKRVRDGVVSNHLNDNVRAGDLLRVHGPAGTFFVAPAPAANRRIVIFAAGTGITPMLPILREILAHEPHTRIQLVYGNRSEASVLFAEELDAMVARSSGRLSIRHVLSRPSPAWQGDRGRVDRSVVEQSLGELEDADALFLLCGPDAMMQEARGTLVDRGVSTDHILLERFVSPRSVPASLPSEPQPATFRLAGQTHEVVVPAKQTLLSAGLEAGLPLGYSCAMGGCGACKLKLLRGSVRMDEPNALTSQEREAGYVLACIAHPTEPVEVESQ